MSQEATADPRHPTPSEASRTVVEEQPVRRLQRDGVDYTLIGTAHVSRASADAVRELAASGEFNAIAVELCQARYDALTAERKWTDLDLYRVRTFREGDQRRLKPRFSAENRLKIQRLLDLFRPIADRHGISLGQLAIA